MCPSLQSPPPGCPAGDSGWSHSSVTGQQERLGGWSKEQQRLVNRGAWWKHVCVCGKSAVCSHYVHWQWPEDHAKGTPASYSASQPPVFSGSVCIWDCVCVCVTAHEAISISVCVRVIHLWPALLARRQLFVFVLTGWRWSTALYLQFHAKETERCMQWTRFTVYVRALLCFGVKCQNIGFFNN